MSRTVSPLNALPAVMLLAACGGPELLPYQNPPGRVQPQAVGSRSGGLSRVPGCDGLLDLLRQRERRILSSSIEANRDYAVGIANDRGENCFDPNDDGCFLFCDVSFGGSAEVYSLDNSAPKSSRASDGGAEHYTGTNNQVAGVAEPDFIKNDGENIYLVTENTMHVVDAWPADDAHILANVEIPGRPQQMLLQGDRLVVFSVQGESNSCGFDASWMDPEPIDSTSTSIRIYDVSTPSKPRLERHIEISGELVNARQVGETMHAVIGFGGLAQSGVAVWPDEIPRDLCNSDLGPKKVRKAFERLLARLDARLAETTLVDFLPGLRDTDHDGNRVVAEREELFTACDGFYAQPGAELPGYLSVLSFSVANDSTFGAAHILGRGGEVYASAQSLYVAVEEFDTVNRWGATTGQHMKVHKFALGVGAEPATYRGSGTVAGRIINQFAMDEYEDHLRIATTEGDWDFTNNLFVLGEDLSGSLKITGAIVGIAPTEDIRSVRFAGDRGFMVTFKKTDPLFTFDLSNPTSPQIVGELKIPGFSTYMHFIDDDHLLTIGFDTDDQGSFAWFQGVMLQIFDVSDMLYPRLKHKEIIGNRGSSSDATADHLAFTWYPERDLLAIPMGICEGDGSGGSFGDELAFSGLLVYGVSTETGFAAVGGVDHRGGGETSTECGSWWTDPDSQVKRSVFMEDYVYSLSSGTLKANHLDALDEDLVSLDLPPLPEEQVCLATAPRPFMGD